MANKHRKINLMRLTARVTRLGWEGGVALETGFHRSQENAKKRGAYPKSGARIVRRCLTLWMSLYLSYQDVVIPYLAITVFENFKSCLLSPVSDLLPGRMIMIDLFIRILSIHNR